MLLALVAASAIQAQTLYFDRNGTTSGSGVVNGSSYNWNSNFWSTNVNGTSSTSGWTAGAIANFSAGTDAATLSYTANINANTIVGGIQLQDGNVTVGGNSTLILTGTPVFDVSSGRTLTVNRPVFLSNTSTNRTLNVTGAGNTTLTGVVSNGNSSGSSILKTGTGTLTLSGANTFSGGVTLSAGTLRATTNNAALGSGTLTLAGGELQLANGSNRNFARNTTVTGNTTITADRLASGGAITHTLGTLSIGAQTLTINRGSFVTSGTGNITFGASTFTGNSTLDVGADAQLTLGAINTSGSARTVTKEGAGLLVLGTAAGTITSGSSFVVADGITRVTNASALGTNVTGLVLAPSTASGTANFQIQGNGVNPTFNSVLFAGAANSTSTISTPSGNGSTGLTLGGNITYDAANNPGAATISSRVFLGSANRTFNIGNSSNTDAELTISGIISGTNRAITKTGTGTLVLSGANTFNGALTISDGVVSIGTITNTSTAGALGQNNSLVLEGGTLRYTGATASSNRIVTLANAKTGTLEVGAANTILTLSGATASTSGTLNKTGEGTLLLSGNNQHSGGTTVTEGTLRATGANSLGSGTATLAGGTLDLANNSSTNFGNNVVVTADSTLSANRTSSGAGPTHTLGTLSIGDHTLTTLTGSLATGSSGLTFGATTLTGAATLNVGSANNTVTLGALSDGGNARSLTKTGGGTLTLGAAASSIVNGTAINLEAGTLNSNHATALGTLAAVNVSGGTLNLGASQTLGSLAGIGGTVNLNANTLTIGSSNNLSGSYSGAIIGTGSLVKAGSGTLTLGGANSYSGGTTVNAGTLQLTGSGTLGSTSAALLVNGGTLDLGGTTQSTGALTMSSGSIVNGTLQSTSFGVESGTISAILAGSGALTKTTAGTVTLSGANTYSGGTTLNAGTLALGNNTALGTGLLTVNGGTLSASGGARTLANNVTTLGNFTFGGSSDLTFSGNFSLGAGDRTITVSNSGTTTLSGVVSQDYYASITKAGTGRLVLSNANTFQGPVLVSAGTLALANDTALGTGSTWGNVVSSGATLELSNNITVTEGGFTVAGTGVGGVGAIHNLSGNNTLNGQIVASGATTITSTAGDLTVGSYTNLDGHALTVSGAGNTTFSAQVHGSGSTLTKDGTGTLTLAGTNSHTGATTINNGTLVAANASALGTADAGTTVNSGGTLALQGDVSILYENITVQGTGFGGAGAIRNLSGTNTLNNTVTLANNATLASDAGTLTLANGLTGTNRSVIFTGSGNTTVSGSMSLGTGSVTKNGSGVVTFLAGNTYSGGTTINAGALNVRHNNALGTGSVTVNSGGTLEMQGGNVWANNALTLAGGTLRNVSGDLNWIQGAVTVTADSTIYSATANDRIYVGNTGNAINLGTHTLTIDGPGKTILVGAVGAAGEAGNIVINSTGDVWFNSQGLTNNFTGTTTVNRGTLYLGTSNHVSFNNTTIRGDLIIGNGTDTAAVVYPAGYGIEKIADTSHVTINRYGTLNLNNSYDTIGALTMNGGTITLGTGGTLVLTDDFTVGASDTTSTITGYQFWLTPATGDRTINVADGSQATDLLITAQVASGNLVKTGDGRLTLAGNNIYSGPTSVNEGILNIRTNTALGGATNGTTVASGATLELQKDAAYNNGNDLTIASEALTLNGTGVGNTGALRNVAGNNTWGGAITLGSAARINSDADRLTINGAISGTNQNLTVGGAGDTWINGVIGTAAGTLTKDGTGTLTLTGSNNYSGATTINSGVVNVRHNYGLGSTAGGVTVASGAALQLQADPSYNGGNPINVGNESLSLSGTGISNTGALRNIAGDNTYGGTVTVASSTARINSDANTLTLSNTVALGSNTLTVGGAGNTTHTGQLTGTNSSVLNKDGTGTLTLSNSTNTFSGDVNVQNGTLAFGADNALNNSSIDLAVGSNGTVDLVSFAQSVGTIAGAGLIDFNTGGELSLASTSTWSGQFTGSGTIIVGEGVTLTLASNIYAPNVNIILAGGTLNMADGDHVFGNLTVTGNSSLNFSGSSTFEIENLFFSSLDYMLSIVNWTENQDFFYSRTQPGERFNPPLNQVTFGPSGGPPWDGSHTRWQDWDSQITPVPEPSTYGAMLMGAGLAFFGYRRWRRQRQAATATKP